jgi:ABC-type antimicrobial peptide transport system permease subunit
MLDELGANVIFVTPYFDLEASPFEQSSTATSALPMSYYDLIKDKPYVEIASPFVILAGFVAHESERSFTTIAGCTPAFVKIRPYEIDQGRLFTDQEVQDEALVVVLGYSVANKLFPDGGAVGSEVIIKGEKFQVVGTFKEKGRIYMEDLDSRVFIPLPVAQRLFNYPHLHVVAFRFPKGMSDSEVVKLAKSDLAAARGLDEKNQDEFQVFSAKEIAKVAGETFRIFGVILLSVSSVALVVAGILIMTVMLMSVMEQTRQIGVRRAVGARRGDILAQFLTEALLQVVGGQALGLVLGIASVWFLCLKVEWYFVISLETIITAVAFSLLVGILFGLLPAYRAAMLDPVDCLRYE